MKPSLKEKKIFEHMRLRTDQSFAISEEAKSKKELTDTFTLM